MILLCITCDEPCAANGRRIVTPTRVETCANVKQQSSRTAVQHVARVRCVNYCPAGRRTQQQISFRLNKTLTMRIENACSLRSKSLHTSHSNSIHAYLFSENIRKVVTHCQWVTQNSNKWLDVFEKLDGCIAAVDDRSVVHLREHVVVTEPHVRNRVDDFQTISHLC